MTVCSVPRTPPTQMGLSYNGFATRASFFYGLVMLCLVGMELAWVTPKADLLYSTPGVGRSGSDPDVTFRWPELLVSCRQVPRVLPR
jgi:hypothetical protein